MKLGEPKTDSTGPKGCADRQDREQLCLFERLERPGVQGRCMSAVNMEKPESRNRSFNSPLLEHHAVIANILGLGAL
jgi:hypothetical protein